ncbi:MAG: PAS domain-containing protein [Candidatus Woesearchaeota archaeon]
MNENFDEISDRDNETLSVTDSIKSQHGFLAKLFPHIYVNKLEQKVLELERHAKEASKRAENEHNDLETYKTENQDLRDKLSSASIELRDAYSNIRTLQSKISGMSDMLQHLEVPYLEIDNNGIVKLINHQVEDLFGFQESEILGKHITSYLADESSTTFLSLIPTMMDMQYEGASHKATLKTSKGTKSMVLRFKYVADDNGKYMGTVVFFEEKARFTRWKSLWKNEYHESLPENADDSYKQIRFGHLIANIIVEDVATVYLDMKKTREISDTVIDSIMYIADRRPQPEVYIQNPSDEIRAKLIEKGFNKDHFEPSHVE